MTYEQLELICKKLGYNLQGQFKVQKRRTRSSWGQNKVRFGLAAEIGTSQESPKVCSIFVCFSRFFSLDQFCCCS